MTVLSRLGPPTLAVGLTAVGVGCTNHTSKELSPGPHAAPARAADCDDLPALGGDPGILLGTDWSGEHHDYADTVIVYACVSPSLRGCVSLVADTTRIRIRPHLVPGHPSGSGILPFRVTVLKGASGGLRVQLAGGASADLPGPVVASDGDGWHFIPHTT